MRGSPEKTRPATCWSWMKPREEFVEGYAVLCIDKFEILGGRVFKNHISIAVPGLVFQWPI